MTPLHLETDAQGKPVCVQWLEGDKHYTGRRMCYPNGLFISDFYDTEHLVKISCDGGEAFVEADKISLYPSEPIEEPTK